MKKIISFFILISMLTSFAVTTNVFADNAEITVSADKGVAIKGETITYSISASNIDVRGLQMTLNYNETQIEFVSCEKGELIKDSSSTIVPNNGYIGIAVAYNDSKNQSGKLCDITFKVKEDAEEGYDEISITNLQNEKGTMYATLSTQNVHIYPFISINATSSDNAPMPGESFEYTLSVDKAFNMQKLQFDLKFDNSVFEFCGCTYGEVMNKATFKAANGENEKSPDSVRILAAPFDGGFTGGGELIKINFKVRETAPEGIYPFFVTNSVSDSDEAVGKNLDNVAVSFDNPVKDLALAVRDILTDKISHESKKSLDDAFSLYNSLTDREKEQATESYNALILMQEELNSLPMYSITKEYDEGLSLLKLTSLMCLEKDIDAPTILVCDYSDDGHLLDIHRHIINANLENTDTISVSVSKNYKVLIWNSIDSMKPFEDVEIK